MLRASDLGSAVAFGGGRVLAGQEEKKKKPSYSDGLPAVGPRTGLCREVLGSIASASVALHQVSRGPSPKETRCSRSAGALGRLGPGELGTPWAPRGLVSEFRERRLAGPGVPRVNGERADGLSIRACPVRSGRYGHRRLGATTVDRRPVAPWANRGRGHVNRPADRGFHNKGGVPENVYTVHTRSNVVVAEVFGC